MLYFIKSLKEEFLRIFKDPKYILIVVLIPTLVSLALCYMYLPGVVKGVNTAIVDMDNTSLSRKIIWYFENNETFKVNYYLNDDKNLEGLIKAGKVDVVVFIPEGLEKDVKNQKSPKVLLVVNGTNMSVSSICIEKSAEILMTVNAEITVSYLEAKGVPPDKAKNFALGLPFEKRIWYNPTRNYGKFLMPGAIASLFQISIVLGAATSVNGSKYSVFSKEMSFLNRLSFIMGKIIFHGLIGAFFLNMTYFLSMKYFFLGRIEVLKNVAILSLPFALTISAIGVFSSLILREQIASTEIAMFLVLPTLIYCGYTWPTLSMPPLLAKIARLIPLYYFADPAKSIMMTGASLKTYFYNFNALLIYFCAIFTCICIVLIFCKRNRKAVIEQCLKEN
ncbi:Inner membrane transport permease YbhR [Fervidicola ferrireducens]|uniref:Inner membrane transport permease YbhR n=1 Tax=Fervidicola ferrireducens TaxID=520764 RepID=A0A140L8S7_9FIRM|nr:ABC transporter permease [Fervidicola ferrireducens]KXG76952.1 Inner membrane transport permease YbhR [Fervidicola ferrireducens]